MWAKIAQYAIKFAPVVIPKVKDWWQARKERKAAEKAAKGDAK